MAQDSALSKTIIFMALVAFMAIAALTATLPVRMPRNQKSQGLESLYSTYPTGISDTGDTAWMMVATIFGFFLGPAIANLYILLYGLHVDLMKTVLVSSSIITTLWIVMSFSLVYGEDNNVAKVIGHPQTYYMFRYTGANSAIQNNAETIPNSIFSVYELGFALVSPVIIAASVAGRVNINAFLLFITFWHLLIYCPITHVVWYETSWFDKYNINDFGGGIVIHQLSTITALVLHLILNQTSEHIDVIRTCAISNRAALSSIVPSILAVWFLWFGFISGKDHSASPIATQAIVNTLAASSSALIMSYFYDLIFELVTTPVSSCVAILIALVAISPSAGYVTVGGAMVISVFAIIVTRLLGQFVFNEGNRVNEPLSILTIHGVAGAVGFLCTAILSYEFINPEGVNGVTYGDNRPLRNHTAALASVWGAVFVCVYALARMVNYFVPLGVKKYSTKSVYYAPRRSSNNGGSSSNLQGEEKEFQRNRQQQSNHSSDYDDEEEEESSAYSESTKSSVSVRNITSHSGVAATTTAAAEAHNQSKYSDMMNDIDEGSDYSYSDESSLDGDDERSHFEEKSQQYEETKEAVVEMYL